MLWYEEYWNTSARSPNTTKSAHDSPLPPPLPLFHKIVRTHVAQIEDDCLCICWKIDWIFMLFLIDLGNLSLVPGLLLADLSSLGILRVRTGSLGRVVKSHLHLTADLWFCAFRMGGPYKKRHAREALISCLQLHLEIQGRRKWETKRRPIN